MNVYNILWWAIYIICAIIIQEEISDFDAFVPGFLIALQERKKVQIIWLFLLFCLIQEGTGSLRFGMSLLWYGGQIVFFHASARFFIADNFFSVTLLSLVLSVYRAIIFLFMCAFQNYSVNYQDLLQTCIIQAVLVPILWYLARLTRPRISKNGN